MLLRTPAHQMCHSHILPSLLSCTAVNFGVVPLLLVILFFFCSFLPVYPSALLSLFYLLAQLSRIGTGTFLVVHVLYYAQMLRLSLRRWCVAATATTTPSSSSVAALTSSAVTKRGTLPDFYGKNFTVAPRTWEQINKKNAEEGFANDARFLRLAIDSGGCHGYLYKFSFEPVAQLNAEEDVVITEADAVPPTDEAFTGAQPSPRVVVDMLSVSKLDKATLDYHSELKGSAFVVVGNELVDQSCACAMSFSLKKKKTQGAVSTGAAAAKNDTGGSGGVHSQVASTAASPAGGSSGGNARPITRRSTARASS